MCGDFTARCAALDDYICGIDNISGSEVIDFHLNNHVSVLTNTFIDRNCCILNDRNHIGNKFTLVCPQGCSVADNCLVSYEYLA